MLTLYYPPISGWCWERQFLCIRPVFPRDERVIDGSFFPKE